MNFKKITFIGGGNMAQSLINGILKANYPKDLITVCTPHEEKVSSLINKFQISGTTNNTQGIKESEVIVLAVKPQMALEALKEAKEEIKDFSDKLVISVMAGITVNRIKELLPNVKRVVRVMPNTPCLIGYGFSGAFKEGLNQEEETYAQDLLSSCGKVLWVNTEEKIDEITALSGSAPAYFFLFLECMQNKAKEYGFSDEDARLILENVALGASMMVLKNQDKSLGELRQAVTSKGGTTAKALDEFNKADLNKIVSLALDACKNRAIEMAKQF